MIWSLITGNPVFRAVAWVLGLLAGIVTFGAYQRRRGASEERGKAREAALRDNIKTRKEVDDAIEGIGGMSSDDLRQWLRDRDAGKP